MTINGNYHRSIWLEDDGWSVGIFDQRALPWDLRPVKLVSIEQAAQAIEEMWTRGAPMIAMTGAYGLCLALREDASDSALNTAYQRLLSTRPTAVNLRWALDRMRENIAQLPLDQRVEAAYRLAALLCDEDVAINRKIGQHGLKIIKSLAAKHPDRPVRILTHCNAGSLATVDFGTATAPIYLAQEAGIPIHVWVDETRPRNQGASLTAFELQQAGITHQVVTDNAGGYLMQNGLVDVCIVGADRVTANGDVCNKIGTYLKAIAAYDHQIPFYIALPYPTIDLTLPSGQQIPIEERNQDEVTHIFGLDEHKNITQVQLTLSPAFNPGFDITPARLVTGYLTDKGLLKAEDLALAH